MKRLFLHGAIAAAATVWLAPGAAAHSHKTKGLEIVHPWCFATGDRTPASVDVYMLIKNRRKGADRLVGATSASAQAIAIVAPSGAGARAPAGIAVQPGRETALKRDGPRLVLTGLTRPLAAYDSFLLTLVFAKAGSIEVEVIVEEAPPAKHD